MPKNSHRFFSNAECDYFPCHKEIDPENFNCMFCYCPLYFVPDCGGDFVIRRSGVKDCTGCLIPHQPESHDRIVGRMREIILEIKNKAREERENEK